MNNQSNDELSLWLSNWDGGHMQLPYSMPNQQQEEQQKGQKEQKEYQEYQEQPQQQGGQEQYQYQPDPSYSCNPWFDNLDNLDNILSVGDLMSTESVVVHPFRHIRYNPAQFGRRPKAYVWLFIEGIPSDLTTQKMFGPNPPIEYEPNLALLAGNAYAMQREVEMAGEQLVIINGVPTLNSLIRTFGRIGELKQQLVHQVLRDLNTDVHDEMWDCEIESTKSAILAYAQPVRPDIW